MVRSDGESEVSRGLGRVLFMDDEEIIRVYGLSLLSYLGYSVETAADGEEAVSLFTKRKK